jgi:environmental stress-induced protein Ves
MKILRAAERVATPWKNGGGVTREVAVWPPGAGLDAFDWRVSIAEVNSAGPFSHFPGIDRILAILEGRMALDFADSRVELDAYSPPLAFPGDVSCSGTPIGGEVTDLNVMARRGRCAARVERAKIGRTAGARTLIVALSAPAIRIGAQTQSLDRHDTAMIDGDVSFSLDGMAFVIRMD